MNIGKNKTFFLLSLLTILFISTSLISARPDAFGSSYNDQLNKNPKKGGGTVNDNGPGGFFGPGSGFGNIPGFGNGWGNGMGGGYGAGFGGPSGGYSKGGIIRSSVVCKEIGPCYMKKLICPAKCFTSFSRSGKGYGGGGGGGGCTIDCKKKCVAYC